jgi:hypothetical protein
MHGRASRDAWRGSHGPAPQLCAPPQERGTHPVAQWHSRLGRRGRGLHCFLRGPARRLPRLFCVMAQSSGTRSRVLPPATARKAVAAFSSRVVPLSRSPSTRSASPRPGLSRGPETYRRNGGGPSRQGRLWAVATAANSPHGLRLCGEHGANVGYTPRFW